jgi:hypothetical protein
MSALTRPTKITFAEMPRGSPETTGHKKAQDRSPAPLFSWEMRA